MDEVKEGVEELKAELQSKTKLLDCMKKAHNEQLTKFQEAKLQIEKQAKELNAQSVQISEAMKIYEDLKCRFHEKESVVRQLSSVNEELRADCNEKVQKLEGENGELVLALDNATAKNTDLEQKICACNEEIGGLKRMLSILEKKCVKAEQKAQLCKELRQRDGIIAGLEEEHTKIQDQLKWKKEQFEHLEAAHEKLRDEFCSSKKEWEREKSALLEEMSSLQTSLDSQTRISEGLQTQLMMSNQALAREESRRRLLEVQVSESQSLFDDVYAKCQEAQSKIENLTVQRDEEIAKLRNLLGTKDTLFKEMEFKIVHLEQENQELHGSLKELQEAQINNAGAAASLATLRNKLRDMEHVHSNCSKKLKARESEWKSQLEKVDEEMNKYLAKLKVKESEIQELQKELEGCQFSLELLNEEMTVVLIVLKSEFSEAYSKLLVDLELKGKEVASLTKKVESSDHLQKERLLMEKEFTSLREMLEESSSSQHQLEEKVLHMGNALKDASDALKKANSELAKKNCDKDLIELELHKWKSTAESLKISLEETQEMHGQMGTSHLSQVETEQTLKQENQNLLCTVKKQGIMMGNLKQQIVSLEATTAAKSQEVESLKQGELTHLRMLEEKDRSIEKLQNEFAGFELESLTRVLEGTIVAQLDAENTFKQEKERLLEIIKEKGDCIEDLQVRAQSLEEDFTHGVISSFSEVTEKQIVIDVLREALNKANYLSEVGIQDRNKTIAKLEKEVNNFQQTLKSQEEFLFTSKRHIEQLEHLLEAKNAELNKLTDRFSNEQRTLECNVEELKLGKGILLDDLRKLSSERVDILTHMQQKCDSIISEDARLMEMLRKILQAADEDLTANAELGSTNKKNAPAPHLPTRKIDVSTYERSPLREINNQQ